MADLPPVPLQTLAVHAGPDLSLPVPIFVGAEVLAFRDTLLWSVLDCDPGSQADRPLERRLRMWKIGTNALQAIPMKDQTCLLESGHEASFAVAGQHLVAVVAHNAAAPAVILRWDLGQGTDDPWDALRRAPVLTKCSLPPDVAWKVKVPPADLWSSPGLAPAAWVFAPRIRMSLGRLLASLDTADGRTAVLEIDPRTGAIKEFGHPSFRAIEPVSVRHEEKEMVLGRGPDQTWSGYYDNPILNFRRGAVALPIVAGVGNRPSTVFANLENAIPGITGVPSYAFDVATRPNGQQVLGMVVGDRLSPTLLIHRSMDAARSASVPLALPLQGRVARLRLAASDSHLSICVVYVVNGQFRVDFYHRLCP